MSLTRNQMEATAEEHRAHLDATGLTYADVLADLEWDSRRLAATLGGNDSTDPVDAWELRDYLVAAVRDRGVDVEPYSVLTDANKQRATQWFDLRAAPRHDFG